MGRYGDKFGKESGNNIRLLKERNERGNKSIKVVELSGGVEELIKDKDKMSRGDFQGCVEAVIMKAIQYGKGLK